MEQDLVSVNERRILNVIHHALYNDLVCINCAAGKNLMNYPQYG